MGCQFDEDAYRSQQLERHLADQEMGELVSNCCGEPIIEESINVCSACREHCEVVELGEYMYEKRLAAEEDAADAQRELKQEQDNG